ncbi:MAG: hypothetical protein H5U40_04110, partial [Polyangiaceae bacterium]|nr:hypothetical protein [Polyangiaceae bacterium]
DDAGGGAGGGAGTGGGGGGGIVGLAAEPEAIAQLGDKLLVAGAMNGDFFVARYELDGTLDTTFADQGVVTIDFGGSTGGIYAQNVDHAYALAATEDAIFVAGAARAIAGAGAASLAIAKLSVDGALDLGFGNAGLAITTTAVPMRWNRVHVADSGSLYAVGTVYNGASLVEDVVAARLTSAGALDASFSLMGGGAGAIPQRAGSQLGTASALVADGIVAGGGPGFPVDKFDLDGQFDGTFGVAGTYAGTGGDLHGLLALADGGFLLVGLTTSPETELRDRLKLVKLDADGLADPGFGTNGIVEVPYDLTALVLPSGDTVEGGFLSIRGLALAGDGDLLVYVSTLGLLNVYPTVARIDLVAESAEAGFGTDGLWVFQASLPLLGDLLDASEPANQAVRIGDTLYVVDQRVDEAHSGVWVGSVPL